MLVYNSIDRQDATSFLVSFTSDQTAPVHFRVFLAGTIFDDFYSSSQSSEITINVGAGESPFLEILDKDCLVPSIAFPGHCVLNWLSIGSAVSYLIQQYNGTWVTQATIKDDGSGVFNWSSGWLVDESVNQFRVVPVDSSGNQGTPLTFNFFMVRHPDPPNTTITFSTGQFTLTAI